MTNMSNAFLSTARIPVGSQEKETDVEVLTLHANTGQARKHVSMFNNTLNPVKRNGEQHPSSLLGFGDSVRSAAESILLGVSQIARLRGGTLGTRLGIRSPIRSSQPTALMRLGGHLPYQLKENSILLAYSPLDYQEWEGVAT